MGFNIAGLVIDRNYQNDLASLEQILDQKLVFEEEVNFTQASENWKESVYCDVYFTSRGTLVFLGMEAAAFEFPVAKQKTLSFVLSEMTMTFSVNYTRNKFVLRTMVETEGELVEDKGEPLDFEDTESDKSELIYHLMEEVLGESFWDVDQEAKCYRYALEALPKATDQEVQPETKVETIAPAKQPIAVDSASKTDLSEKTSLFGKMMKGLGLK